MSQKKTTYYPGSTATPSTVVTPKVTSGEVATDQVVLSGSLADGIVHRIPEEPHPEKLVSAYGATQLRNELNKRVDDLEFEVDDIYYIPVLSEPIIDKRFNSSDWVLNNFFVDLGQAVFINKQQPIPNQAFLRISTACVKKRGTFFFDIWIKQLPSGNITLYNEKREVLQTFQSKISNGVFRFEVVIENPGIAFFEFVVNNMDTNDVCIVDAISVHHLKSEFEAYMEFAAEKLVSGGSGFVTEEELNRATQIVYDSAVSYINSALSGLGDSFVAHVNDKGNPHGITPAKINAADTIHSHVIADLTDADVQLLQPIQANKTAIDNLVSALAAHVDLRNPHGTSPDDIGAAAAEHTHELADITDLPTLLARILTLEENSVTFEEHINATGNVHHLELDDFDLGYATPAEGIEGLREDKIMNPKVTRAALDATLGSTSVEIERICPSFIGEIVLSTGTEDAPQLLTARFRAHRNRKYRISITSLGGSAKNIIMSMFSPGDATALSIQTNTGQGNVYDIGGVSMNLFGWLKTTEEHYRFIDPMSGIRQINGVFDFDTTSFVLSGQGVGVLGTETYTAIPFIVTASPTEVPEFETFDLVFSIETTDISTQAAISIAEYVQPKDPSILADALPVNTIVCRTDSLDIFGYSKLDGSELVRTNYRESYTQAVTAGNIIDKEDWLYEFTTHGYCTKFHYGDGTATFGIPHVPDKDGFSYRIKLTPITIPQNTNVLYTYLWT